jgi:ribosomal protein S18 acetylase RimI-like enzyme
MHIRHIEDGDWDELMLLENEAYSLKSLSEDRDALLSKQRLSPSTCFVLIAERNIAGYLLSLPYPRLHYPALAQIEATPFQAQNLHLHDLVIGKRFRGRGFAKCLLRKFNGAAKAEDYQSISLIAVAGSEPFWRAQGYERCTDIGFPAGYGEQAVYMQMQL